MSLIPSTYPFAGLRDQRPSWDRTDPPVHRRCLEVSIGNRYRTLRRALAAGDTTAGVGRPTAPHPCPNF